MADAGDHEREGGGEGTGLDRTKLLREVAAQMDNIEGDLGDDFGILAAVSVVLINRPDGNTGFRVRPIDISPLEGIGILSVAQDILKAQVVQGGGQEEPD